MARRVNLDAMIPREDFARDADDDVSPDLIRDFPISNLLEDSPIRRQLRKPDFQRETNHWTPVQIASFVASFIDKEVIPSLILWKSPSFIFIIDGGHRLSALRAWLEDDYGDGHISQRFYNGEIPEDQKRIARRTRALIENDVGRFQTLRNLVGENETGDAVRSRRAGALFTRPLTLQWVIGSPQVAETSFFKINSQGTPLDETEQMLIRNRRKPIAISARAVIRAGTGHKYWSGFTKEECRLETVSLASDLFGLLFRPELTQPVKTLDVPLGGSASPVEALSLLIDFVTIAASPNQAKVKIIHEYEDDQTGEGTVDVLRKSLQIAKRITGTSPSSLGLHPAVYFYNERGKYSRFLFLGLSSLIAGKVRDNDHGWFRKFTRARETIENFLIENKSLIGIVLQNTSRAQRVPRMRDLFEFLVSECNAGRNFTPENVITRLGMRARVFDIISTPGSQSFSDDTKSAVYVSNALAAAQMPYLRRIA